MGVTAKHRRGSRGPWRHRSLLPYAALPIGIALQLGVWLAVFVAAAIAGVGFGLCISRRAKRGSPPRAYLLATSSLRRPFFKTHSA